MTEGLCALRVGVLCGGKSREREVSLRSGANVFAACKRLGLDAVQIDVDNEIAFRLREEGVQLAYIALHGRYGEDGCIQGLLECMDIPYTGSGVLTSAIAMNKLSTKRFLAAEGIRQPPCVLIGQNRAASCTEAREHFGFPLVVKPTEEGSSIAVRIAHDADALFAAANEVAELYPQTIIEQYICGKEITTGILGTGCEAFALPVLGLEPMGGREFYDYEAKYTAGLTRFVLPAALPPMVYAHAQSLALRVHRLLGCRGLSRVDAIVDENGEVWIIEVNTLPGMTETSDIPAEAREAGIDFDALVERILESALADSSPA
ncbi:MAG: D-alanine--D-alanine ligase [Spirochaetota bacterium]|nr:D-alanine--D-alanine ligase [Spirochaetota bacterium]